LGAQACALPISSIPVQKKFAQTKPPTLFLLCEFVGGYTDSFIHSFIHSFTDILEISQERLGGFSISLVQKKRNFMIQMSDRGNFKIRKIDKVLRDFVTKIGLKRLFLNI